MSCGSRRAMPGTRRMPRERPRVSALAAAPVALGGGRPYADADGGVGRKVTLPMQSERYPENWDTIALRVKEAAQWRCQDCGMQCRTPAEPFDTHRRTMSVHHVGAPHADGTPGDPHDKMDVRPENLLALCSACHLRMDLPIHILHAAETRRRKKVAAGQLELSL